MTTWSTITYPIEDICLGHERTNYIKGVFEMIKAIIIAALLLIGFALIVWGSIGDFRNGGEK